MVTKIKTQQKKSLFSFYSLSKLKSIFQFFERGERGESDFSIFFYFSKLLFIKKVKINFQKLVNIFSTWSTVNYVNH